MLMVVSQKVREKTVAKVAAEQAAIAQLLSDNKADESAVVLPIEEPPPVAPKIKTPEPIANAVRVPVQKLELREELKTEVLTAQQRILDLEQRAVALDRTARERKALIAQLTEEANSIATKSAAAIEAQAKLKERLRSTQQKQQVDQQELAQLRAEQDRLRERVLESRKLLAEHRQQHNGNSAHVIVPYDGVTGTTRRPIVLEITDDGIRFVSEQVMVSAADLQHFTPSNNPILAGARELVTYWTARNQATDNPDKQPKPYVLMVVRPSGTLGYYVARGFLTELGTEFGYELVTEDFRFETPPTEERASELCRAAIAQSLRERGTNARPQESFSQALTSELRSRALSGEASPRGGATGSTPKGGAGPQGPGGTFSGLTDSGRRPEKFSAGSLARGGNGAQKFFSSSDFLQHRERVETGSGNGNGQSGNAATASSTGLPGSRSMGQAGNNNDTVAGRPLGGAGASRSSAGESSKERFFDDGPGSSSADASPDGVPSNGSNRTVKRPDQLAQYGDESEIEDLRPQGSQGSKASSSKNSKASAKPTSNNASDADANESIGSNTNKRSATMTPDRPGQGGSENDQPTLGDKRDIKDLTNFKRHWGVPNPKGTIALERNMTLQLNGERVIVQDRYRVTKTQERTTSEWNALTLEAMDVVARDWGPPPSQFYWIPHVDLVVQPGGDVWKESLKRSLEHAGVPVKVRYE